MSGELSAESAQARKRCWRDRWMIYVCLMASIFECLAGRPATAVILGAVTYWGNRTDG